jgi:hypothetical protein
MNTLLLIAVGVVVLVVVFVISREFICWYFKINEIAETLKRIDYRLAVQAGEKPKPGETVNAIKIEASALQTWTCPGCSVINAKSTEKCLVCGTAQPIKPV